MSECPNCKSEQIRERGANLLRNVKRRERGEKLDPFVCDACEWSGTEEMLVMDEDDEVQVDTLNPMEY